MSHRDAFSVCRDFPHGTLAIVSGGNLDETHHEQMLQTEFNWSPGTVKFRHENG